MSDDIERRIVNGYEECRNSLNPEWVIVGRVEISEKDLNNNDMNKFIKDISKDSVKLCCGKKGCPVVRDMGDGTVEITDDNGNKVIMQKEEAALIVDGLKRLDEKSLLLG